MNVTINLDWNHKRLINNVVMCRLDRYDIIRILCDIKLKLPISTHLYEKAVCGLPFYYTIAIKIASTKFCENKTHTKFYVCLYQDPEKIYRTLVMI